jgi:hypothetical protein
MAVGSTEQAVAAIEAAAYIYDKTALTESILIFRDNWNDLIEQGLKDTFENPEVRARIKPLITTELNLLKRVIEARAMVYKRPAERLAVNEITEEEESGDERYQEIVEESDLNLVMKAANQYTELINHVLIRPVIRKDKMTYDIILPNNFDIYTDVNDWNEILAIRYQSGVSPYGTTQPVCTLWVKAPMVFTHQNETRVIEPGVYTYKDVMKMAQWEYKEFPYVADGENILPFVLTYKDYPIDQLLNYSNGSSIPETTIAIAIALAQLGELMKYQSFIQLAVQAPGAVEIPKNMPTGPGTIWKMGEGAVVNSIDVQARIKDFWDVIKERASLFLAQQGIPPSSFTLTGQPQSGYAMKIDHSQLNEIRENALPYWRSFEKKLFELTRMVNNTDMKDKPISENAEFKIDFAETSFEPSPDEKQREWTFLISQNAATATDLIKTNNPDLDDDEAMVKYAKNKAINTARTITPIVQPGTIQQGNTVER